MFIIHLIDDASHERPGANERTARRRRRCVCVCVCVCVCNSNTHTHTHTHTCMWSRTRSSSFSLFFLLLPSFIHYSWVMDSVTCNIADEHAAVPLASTRCRCSPVDVLLPLCSTRTSRLILLTRCRLLLDGLFLCHRNSPEQQMSPAVVWLKLQQAAVRD